MDTPPEAGPNRAERRAELRRARHDYTKVVELQQRLDAEMIRNRKAWLRRRYGNPTKRLTAFREWIESENRKRGYQS